MKVLPKDSLIVMWFPKCPQINTTTEKDCYINLDIIRTYVFNGNHIGEIEHNNVFFYFRIKDLIEA